jgi:hypothetical protein
MWYFFLNFITLIKFNYLLLVNWVIIQYFMLNLNIILQDIINYYVCLPNPHPSYYYSHLNLNLTIVICFIRFKAFIIY